MSGKPLSASERESWNTWSKQELDSNYREWVGKKTAGCTIHSHEVLKTAKQNAKGSRWGKTVVNRIFEIANYWTGKSDTELIDLIPLGNPRALTPGQYYGDPQTGGNRLTLYTSLETPYRWYNPHTKTWLYDGAPIQNPTTKETITLMDEGGGFIPPDGFVHSGEPRMLVAAYRMFIINMLCGGVPYTNNQHAYVPYAPVLDSTMIPGCSGNKYDNALLNLAAAYHLTDRDANKKGNGIRGGTKNEYAYKAGLIMGRLAELYPYMNGTHGDGTRSEKMHWGEISTTESM